MLTYALIGLGGAIGATARHALNGLTHRWLLAPTFPYGILIINVTGSFAIGLIAGLVASSRAELSTDARVFLMVGILGGFTTFSSFSLDTLTLMRSGHVSLAVINVVTQVGLSLLAVAAGYRLGS